MGQLVDSNQQKLKMEEIIKIAAENTQSEYPFNAVFISIIKELTMPDSIIIQLGNTLFIIHRTEDPRVGYFRALNADTAQNYLKNSEQFIKIAYDKYGLDIIASDYSDPKITKIFEYIARKNPTGMGLKLQQTKDGKMFRAIAKIGPERGAF